MDVITNNTAVMDSTKKKSPYSFKVISNLIKNGLFLQGVRHAFAKIGIDIMPYYWVQEEVLHTEKPKLRTDEKFIFKRLEKQDLNVVIAEADSISENKIHQSFADGQECVGLVHNGQIAAYMFIELNDFEIKKRVFKLKPDEAYLLNMFTLTSFRGRNLAPYLRYACYRYLEDRNITTKYSVSNYFNKSAIRFKEKLNSKPRKLYVHIDLFKSLRWDFTLKTFS
ncbi:GNAT family N-acetyltransferase [uncultured Psychroserpens sp.]|uniref:GNAT family N-acetyltransferase n=1 Tax=uncultured Psychroserpens sp. TaxID=255436 RepID=UPI002609D7BF|nr:GNAT family N-acetyltransferase [uncultured Psychroserpens sp.]